jgi:hypothetical protein
VATISAPIATQSHQRPGRPLDRDTHDVVVTAGVPVAANPAVLRPAVDRDDPRRRLSIVRRRGKASIPSTAAAIHTTLTDRRDPVPPWTAPPTWPTVTC